MGAGASPAPHRFVGRSLRELDLRSRAGVQVLLIRGGPAGGGSSTIRVPSPEERIGSSDRLVVAGLRDAVEAVADY